MTQHTCAHSGCNGSLYTKKSGLCYSHYIEARGRELGPCSIDSCQNNAFIAKSMLCRTHYNKALVKAEEIETVTVNQTCAGCGVVFNGSRRSYCARSCQSKHYRQTQQKTCQVEGCTRPHQARGKCATHYSEWYRRNNSTDELYKKKLTECAVCGAPILRVTRKAHRPTCSPQCRTKLRWQDTPQRLPKPPRVKRDWRSPLRRAIEDGGNIIEEVRARTCQTSEGCWEWQGIQKGGYPLFRYTVSGRRIEVAVHRLVLEAKHGAPLGDQAAHHACANSICVNPDHLQPVTHAANTAEMLERRYFVTRIQKLESELAKFDPNNVLLNEIGLKTVV